MEKSISPLALRKIGGVYNKATLHGGSKADTKAESTFLPPKKKGKKESQTKVPCTPQVRMGHSFMPDPFSGVNY